MSTITRERLLIIQQWRETYGPGSNVVLPAAEAEELARIALASLEAEAVKRVNADQMHRVCLEANRHLDKYGAMAKEVNKLLRRTAPPAQVVPDGYVLVPIEPTEKMVIEGFESEPDEFFSKSEEWDAYQEMSGCEQAAHRAKLCWAAMIAAAPQQEVKGE